MKNFTITAAANKKEITITTDEHNRFRSFGEICEFLTRNGNIVLFLDAKSAKKAKAQIEKMFGRKLPDGSLSISLTENSKIVIEKIKQEIAEAKAAYEAAYNSAKAAAEPVAYEMHDTPNYGDYSSSYDRYVRVYRAPLEGFGETGNKVIEIVDFSNKKIGKFEKEWDTQFAAMKGDSQSIVFNISAEQAAFWINAANELKKEEAAKDTAKKEAIAAKKAKKEAATELAFEQARKTGKPVELFSEFLSGNEIPRKFRDEDSDMGNLVTYAMPDGTVSESFYHSH